MFDLDYNNLYLEHIGLTHNSEMSPIKYIGRKSLHFYGKYLSEISKNLKSRGKGRVVIKETETKKFNEPCFYVLDRVVPLMSDSVSFQ